MKTPYRQDLQNAVAPRRRRDHGHRFAARWTVGAALLLAVSANSAVLARTLPHATWVQV